MGRFVVLTLCLCWIPRCAAGAGGCGLVCCAEPEWPQLGLELLWACCYYAIGPQWLAVLAGAWQGMAADVTHASYLLTRILLALCLLSAAGGGGRADCSQDSSAAGADDGARECAGGLWVGAGATCDAGLQLDAASAHRLRIAHRPRIATPWQRACPVFKWGSQLAPLLATLIGSQVCC